MFERHRIDFAVMLLTAKALVEMLNPFRGNKPVVVPTTILLTNPFGAILKITKVIINNTKIPGGDLMLGTANSNDLNFDIPRYGSVWLPEIDLNVDLTQHEEMIVAFILKMEKEGKQNATVLGNFSFVSGGLEFHPKNYRQSGNIPCCIQLPETARHVCP